MSGTTTNFEFKMDDQPMTSQKASEMIKSLIAERNRLYSPSGSIGKVMAERLVGQQSSVKSYKWW